MNEQRQTEEKIRGENEASQETKTGEQHDIDDGADATEMTCNETQQQQQQLNKVVMDTVDEVETPTMRHKR